MTAIERAREAAVDRLLGHRALREQDAAKSDAAAVIETFLAKLAEDGMVLVPRVATEKMCSTYDAHVWLIDPDEFKPQLAGRVWSAMIEAATSPPPPEGKGDGK